MIRIPPRSSRSARARGPKRPTARSSARQPPPSWHPCRRNLPIRPAPELAAEKDDPTPVARNDSRNAARTVAETGAAGGDDHRSFAVVASLDRALVGHGRDTAGNVSSQPLPMVRFSETRHGSRPARRWGAGGSVGSSNSSAPALHRHRSAASRTRAATSPAAAAPPDDSNRRVMELGDGDVVTPDERDVVSRHEAALAKGVQRTPHVEVASGNDRGDRRLGGERLDHSAGAEVDTERARERQDFSSRSAKTSARPAWRSRAGRRGRDDTGDVAMSRVHRHSAACRMPRR